MSNERKPILLNHHACALIMIYNHSDEVFDMVAGAYNDFDNQEVSKEAAKEFISQLKGYWTPRFLKALRSEIDEALNE